MAKKIISLGLLCILGVSMIGCVSMEEETVNSDSGFTKIADKGRLRRIRISEYVDKETGVHYYIGIRDNKAIMSPVYDSNGKVKVDK